MLAEELIKVGRITDGIDVARKAMDTQLNFFHGMKNSNIQETMLLLAEALTIDKKVDEAIEIYCEVLEARTEAGEPTKDIHRAIAPLYSLNGKFVQAAESLAKVLEIEDQELAKVTIYTKIAGNYKKSQRPGQMSREQ